MYNNIAHKTTEKPSPTLPHFECFFRVPCEKERNSLPLSPYKVGLFEGVLRDEYLPQFPALVLHDILGAHCNITSPLILHYIIITTSQSLHHHYYYCQLRQTPPLTLIHVPQPFHFITSLHVATMMTSPSKGTGEMPLVSLLMRILSLLSALELGISSQSPPME